MKDTRREESKKQAFNEKPLKSVVRRALEHFTRGDTNSEGQKVPSSEAAGAT